MIWRMLADWCVPASALSWGELTDHKYLEWCRTGSMPSRRLVTWTSQQLKDGEVTGEHGWKEVRPGPVFTLPEAYAMPGYFPSGMPLGASGWLTFHTVPEPQWPNEGDIISIRIGDDPERRAIVTKRTPEGTLMLQYEPEA
jgi:hypothetical protein